MICQCPDDFWTTKDHAPCSSNRDRGCRPRQVVGSAKYTRSPVRTPANLLQKPGWNPKSYAIRNLPGENISDANATIQLRTIKINEGGSPARRTSALEAEFDASAGTGREHGFFHQLINYPRQNKSGDAWAGKHNGRHEQSAHFRQRLTL